MRHFRQKLAPIHFFFIVFFVQNNLVHSQNIVVKQDPKFEQLLKEKRKVNSGIVTNNRYKIQLFSGNNELSKKALADFKKDFVNFDATIVFNTPNYKVWVGNYKTRIEAEKNLKPILKKYPNALIIKPSKQ
jgi:hypothetical protein